ncbi:uncharacterized protein LOC126562724 [Anopheles maculipalpis]|uniref:uncharacterized protein LOC126562724 n=1 Tax=Anopheles maculipalpis TaxID=1496333 RepID=UPI0021598FA1|nr:uncharacterized protein LOC126562724 [Anopheles maculipalpis]
MDRVALLVLLFQGALVAASPDYGIPNSVIGTGKLVTGVNDASTYLQTLAAGQLVSASITQDVFGLPRIVQILQETGNTVSQDGDNIVRAFETLIQSSSGDPTVLFDAALKSIQDALNHITQLLPTTESNLSAIIGGNVPDRLTDSFARIEIALRTLLTQIGTLKSSVLAAIAEAGSPTSISMEILTKHITLSKVYNVLQTVRNLRAFLPVVRYTLNTSIEEAVEADNYLKAYNSMLASLDGVVTIVLQSLDAAEQSFYATVKSGVNTLGAAYAGMKESTLALGIITEAPDLGAEVVSMLSKFTVTLEDTENDILSVASELQSYLTAVKAMVTITETEVISITESKLIGALIKTLISSGPYARFCFNKYRAQVSDLANYLLDESALCIEREVPRLTNLAAAVQTILDVNAFDFEDIYDWLTICDGIQEPADRVACVARISQSYTALGDNFADKYNLLFDLTTVEVDSSKQRVKICISLTRRWLADGYIPNLQNDIEQCALTGPN